MIVAVTGADGMLGRAVVEAAAAAGHEVSPSGRRELNITDLGRVAKMLEDVRPDVVINCAGKLPERATGATQMIESNALGPWLLYAMCQGKTKLLHVSDARVYSGITGLSGEHPKAQHPYDDPAPRTPYGRSKLAGELPKEAGVCTVRTSFVGPDHGLWARLTEAAASNQLISESDRSWTTASTVWAVARGLVRIAASDWQQARSLVHLSAGEAISQALAAKHISDRLGLSAAVAMHKKPELNFALYPTLPLPSLYDALQERSAW